MSRWHIVGRLGPEWDHWVDLCDHADVYHRSGYVAAMNTEPGALPRLMVLESDLGLVVHPLLLRPLAGLCERFSGLFDATSCYGYGGPAWALCGQARCEDLLSEFWLGEGRLLREMNVVTEFVRLHPLMAAQAPLSAQDWVIDRGPTVAVDLTPAAAQLEAELSTNHRRNIARARQLGVEVAFSKGPEAIDAFADLYTLTMDRLSARPSYYFPRSCFSGLFALPGGSAWLATASLHGQVISAALDLAGESFWHYHLGASNEVARKAGANHLLMFDSMLFAKQLGKTQMHLGGGLGCRSDGLLRYKAGFGGRLCRFKTIQRILYPEMYARLCAFAGIEPTETDYFPAYRRPPASIDEKPHNMEKVRCVSSQAVVGQMSEIM